MAIPVPAAIALTATARRHASQHKILEQVLAAALPDTCQVGDLVALEIHGGVHEFVVYRRRWEMARDTPPRLEITLDRPAR